MPTSVSPARVPPEIREFFGDQLPVRDRGSFGLTEATLAPLAPGCADRYLRVRYPAGSASQRSVADDGAPSGGAQAYLPLRGGPRDDAYLSYRVRFQPGFQFVKGGKLPGLYGGSHVAGGNTPDGTNGFSTRFMWREEGRGQVYAYLPASKDHGTTFGRGRWAFTPGRWIDVQQHVHLNTPGRADGSVTVWIDGRRVYSRADLVYRTTEALRIEGVFFSTFFGGDDLTWASPADQHADFAGFTVTDHRPDPAGARTCRP